VCRRVRRVVARPGIRSPDPDGPHHRHITARTPYTTTILEENPMSDTDNWRFETKQIHSGAAPDPTTNARATPIYQTTSYVFNDADHAKNLFALAEFGNIYTRIQNPTQAVVEERVAALEGGTAALLVSSGQAAETFAVLNIAQAGDHIVSSSSIYGGTYNLFKYTLAKLGIETTFVEDQDDPDEWARAVRPNTKLFFGETIGNPRINILDIALVAGVAHEAGVPLIVDNTIATPYLIRPFEHGADIVVHSATKFLGGHGTVIGGLIVDGGTFEWSKNVEKFPGLTEPDPSYHGASYTTVLGDGIAYIIKARVQLLRDLGSSIAPASAWQLIQGIETLSLRIERHVQNAQAVAEWLDAHDDVDTVYYAGLPSSPWYAAANRYAPKGVGAVLSFELKGGVDAGRALVENAGLFSHLANIGDVRSLIIHPASTTHSQLTPEQQLTTGVTPGLVRLSVGLENIDDILADLSAGLAAARARSTENALV
jgi:O-acetylhomoserine (thiol)-lyase